MRNSNGSTSISSHGSIIQINDSFEKKKQKISKKNKMWTDKNIVLFEIVFSITIILILFY